MNKAPILLLCLFLGVVDAKSKCFDLQGTAHGAYCLYGGVHIWKHETVRIGPCCYVKCTGSKAVSYATGGYSSTNPPPTACPYQACPNHRFIPHGECCPTCMDAEYPEFSGYGNNVEKPKWGAVGSRLLRLGPNSYEDGISKMRASDKNPRFLSQQLFDQENAHPNDISVNNAFAEQRGLTAIWWQWGQFVDHDITLVTEAVAGAESANIPVLKPDPFLRQRAQPTSPVTGIQRQATSSIGFHRADWDKLTGTGPTNPRAHFNSISAFIDGSNVYGSDAFTSERLRVFGKDAEKGWLKVDSTPTTAGDILLPKNADGPNIVMAGGDPDTFAAGDIRANEQTMLTSMHTMWVHEHNYWAHYLATKAGLTDEEEIFQEARKRVMAEMQMITFDEWLPALLGCPLPAYGGYNPTVNPGMSTEFSGALFRFGHSMIADVYQPYSAEDGSPVEDIVNGDNKNPKRLAELFFRPSVIKDSGWKQWILATLGTPSQGIDTKMVASLREDLFDQNLDLAALNIQRGRDMGIPTYNDFRESLGLSRVDTTDLPMDVKTAYDWEVDDVDLWVGILSEKPVDGSSVGETLRAALIEQFTRLRDGDRFYWANWLGTRDMWDVKEANPKGVLKGVIDRHIPGLADAASGAKTGTKFAVETTKSNNYFMCGIVTDCLWKVWDQTPSGTTFCGTSPSASTYVNPTTNKPDMVYANNKMFCVSNECQWCPKCDISTQPWKGKVCGNDWKTYADVCALQTMQCWTPWLHPISHGECGDKTTTLEYRSDIYFHNTVDHTQTLTKAGWVSLKQSMFGGPVVIDGTLDGTIAGKGAGGLENGYYDLYFVDGCYPEETEDLNPLADPRVPRRPLGSVSISTFSKTNKVWVVAHDVSLVNQVAGVLYGNSRCDSPFGTTDHSLLHHGLMLRKRPNPASVNKGNTTQGNQVTVKYHSLCGGIEGQPWVVLQADLKTSDSNWQGASVGTVTLKEAVHGSGDATIELDFKKPPQAGRYFVDIVQSCGGGEEFFYALADTDHYLGELPPLVDISFYYGSENDQVATQNHYLRLVGTTSPVNQYVRWIQVKTDAKGNQTEYELACGKLLKAKDGTAACDKGGNSNQTPNPPKPPPPQTYKKKVQLKKLVWTKKGGVKKIIQKVYKQWQKTPGSKKALPGRGGNSKGGWYQNIISAIRRGQIKRRTPLNDEFDEQQDFDFNEFDNETEEFDNQDFDQEGGFSGLAILLTVVAVGAAVIGAAVGGFVIRRRQPLSEASYSQVLTE